MRLRTVLLSFDQMVILNNKKKTSMSSKVMCSDFLGKHRKTCTILGKTCTLYANTCNGIKIHLMVLNIYVMV